MNENLPKRGRPRDPERLRSILDAAARQFVELGFERVSMDAIAKLSGTSKATIYSYFPTKEALFDAVVGKYTDTVLAALSDMKLDPSNPQAALLLVGRQFLQLIRSDDVIGTFRMMFAAAGQQPAACRVFFHQGPQRAIIQLADYLRAAEAAGSLEVEQPELAANQFFSLFLGREHIQTMLGLGKPTPEEDELLLNANVAIFMRAQGYP